MAMKRAIIGLFVAMVICLFLTPANALDTCACTDGRFNAPGQTCIGLLEPSDMGSFDENGDFVWDDDFIDEIESWGAPGDWQTRWVPSRGFGITSARFDLRRHVVGQPDSKLTINGGLITESPWLWRVEGGFFGYFIPPENPNDPWFDLDFYSSVEALKAEHIDSFVWNSETVSPQCNTTYDMIFMRYQMAPQGPNWYYEVIQQSVTIDTPDIVSERFSQIPDEIGLQTVDVNLVDGNPFSLSSFSLDFNVESVDELPVVPAVYDDYFVNPTGRSTKKTIEVENITAKEDDQGNLIVQWAEPTIAKPGIFLRIFVGHGWNSECINGVSYQNFLFLDCPSQTGTVVVPADQYLPFKENLLNQGYSIGVAGMYRQHFQHQMDNGWQTQFHNRGYFEWIPVE